MGNRSVGPSRGVPRVTVKLAGVFVHASVCVPRAHAHALWLLPWIEGLLSGRSLASLIAAPPWPHPGDVAISRRLVHTLIDLRWAVPVWSRDEVVLHPRLAAAFRSEGRIGLARALFDVAVVPGTWWAEGLSGAVLARVIASAFDWDLRRRADHDLPFAGDPQTLIDTNPPDLGDLVRKLGAVQALGRDPTRAFLGTPPIAGEPKAIFFTMTGADFRLLPDELAELEPVLAAHAPELFGARTPARSRVVRLPTSPIERVARVVEQLPVDLVATGPTRLLRERVAHLTQLVARSAADLAAWLDDGLSAWSVLGPAQRHFDAVAELCAHLDHSRPAVVLLTTAFLHPAHASDPDGLASSLAAAPPSARFLVLYGHASDDLPDQQSRDAADWLAALTARQPALAGRVRVVTTRHRSHEKVVLTSDGGWLVGSWNPGSSRPHAAVFEASLAGRSPAFAARLLARLATNVEHPDGQHLVDALRVALTSTPGPAPRGAATVARLRDALALLEKATPPADDQPSTAWPTCVRAVRAALQSLLACVHVEPVDEHQTRDAFLAHVRETRRDILLASDRLADSALDGAVLRDLRGDGRTRRIVRVIWGREWAGRRPTDPLSDAQLQRARRTVRDARERLGPALRTSEAPMENHGKLLIADGLRGIVTSENLLSYGGEKGRHETRELGLMFWSPVIARRILGRVRLHWPAALAEDSAPDGPPLAWIAAGDEAWHGLAAIADQLEFDWRAAGFLEHAVRDELTRAPDDADSRARRRAFAALESRAGRQPFAWVREEGERLGLLVPSASETWLPHDASADALTDEWLTAAAAAIAVAPPPPTVAVVTHTPRTSPLLDRILAQMIEIPPGTFLMGDDRVAREAPRHRVTITRPFLLGRTPVTQGLWQAVMGALPALRDVERHPDHPIIHVSLADMRTFLDRINSLPGSDGFELPTEAQWEYACRAGADTHYCFGDDPGPGERPGPLERHAWTKRNARARLQPVGQLQPNAFGLYDMHGLVYETMRDGPRAYNRAAVTDPLGPLAGVANAARGGCWGRFPVDPRRPDNEHFRCASRQTYEPSHRVSFRLARRLPEGA